jgi:hypothetical protein
VVFGNKLWKILHNCDSLQMERAIDFLYFSFNICCKQEEMPVAIIALLIGHELSKNGPNHQIN